MAKPVVLMDVMKQIHFIMPGFAPTLAACMIANRNALEAGA
jgi:hypothetical protein